MPTMRRFAAIPVLAIVASAVLIALSTFSSPHSAQGIIPPFPTPPPFGVALVVNTKSDLEDPGDGTCSLRAAIEATNANAHAGNCDASLSQAGATDGIFFKIGPGGVETISPTSSLPAITDKLAINGTTQPVGPANCGAGKAPCIRLDGSSAGNGSGLEVSSNGVTVRGLAITGFRSAGIETLNTTHVTIAGNYIGTADGVTAAGNFEGIQAGFGASTVSNVTIGGNAASDRNVISGNEAVGIVLVGNDNFVQGNYVGTAADGTSALGNHGGGIDMAGGPNNVIGGTAAGAGNVISGNIGSYGLQIFAASATQVFGNLIGTDSSGAKQLGNGFGILVDGGSGNVIGSQDPGAGNVISANSSGGLQIRDSSSNQIEHNIIGLNLAGTQTLGNNGDGVSIESTSFDTSSNLITYNVISGNRRGIHLQGAKVSGTRAFHNLIGTDVAGSAPLGNSLNGIAIQGGSHGNEFQYNTIAASVIGAGISVADTGSTGNSFRVNYVGTNANGDALGNAKAGIYVQNASYAQIGTEAAPLSANEGVSIESAAGGGNVIRQNRGPGVLIDGASAQHNAISGNSIDNNVGLGIQLTNGGNNNQASPVLSSAITISGSTHVVGTMTSAANAVFRIEFFASPACDPSGTGEGRDYLGSTNVTTNGAGAAAIDLTLTPGASAGQKMTATSIDDGFNTSQFSNCVKAAGPTPTPTPKSTPSPTPTQHPSPTPPPSGSVQLKGDADCNGHIDVNDVLAALSSVVGARPGASCPALAEVDCDGNPDAEDALRILDYVAGTPLAQPSGCPGVGTPTT